MTGRQEGENFSRLCKRKLLARFCGLLDNLPTITEVDAGAVKCLSYGEIKALSADYQVNANTCMVGNITILLIMFYPHLNECIR